MLKKTLSWVLLVALLLSCMIFPSLALEPQSDTAAVDSGYQFKYETDSGTVYGKFEKVSNNELYSDLDSIPAGSTVTLLTDIRLDKAIYLRKRLTINGAGHTLTNVTLRSDDLNGFSDVVVTIQNVKFVSTLSGSGYNRYFYQIANGAACTFENCTFTLSGSVAAACFVPRGNLTFQNCALTMTSNADLSGKLLFFISNSEKNHITAINSTFDITGASKLQPGLVAGYNNYYYSTYAEALAQVPAAGGTVTLLAGYEILPNANNKEYRAILSGSSDRNVTFDGQGQTLVGTTGSYLVGVNGNITIKNLNLTQQGENQDYSATIQVNANATLTVADSTLTATKASKNGAVVIVQKNAKLILQSGAKLIHNGSANNNSASVGVRLNEVDASLTVYEGAEITTVGNTVKADVAATSTVTFEGGTIKTGRMVWASDKTGNALNVKGGTFVSTDTQNPPINTYGNNPTVNLCGGTFTAPSGKIFSDQGAIKKLGGTIVLNGKTILKAPGAEDLKTMGAALYLPTNATQENSGIRFETRLSKAWIDELIASGATITTGTLLAPKALVEKLGGLTHEALNGKGLHIENDGWNNAATATADGYYRYFGNMIQLSLKSLTGEIAGVGYVTVTVPGYGTVTYYGPVQSGIVREIAKTVATDGLNPAQQEVLRFFAGSQVTTTP